MPKHALKQRKQKKSKKRTTSATTNAHSGSSSQLAIQSIPQNFTPDTISHLQRTIGNQATIKMIQRSNLKSIRDGEIREVLAENEPKMIRDKATKLREKEDVGAFTARMVDILNGLLKNPLDVWGKEELYAKVRPIVEEVHYPRAEVTNVATLAFGGAVAGEGTIVNKIKEYLPSNGHGDISGAMNDVLLERGKATSGHDDVLHASAGKSGRKGGCTLFFKRDDDNNVDIVGVGQHKTSSSYTIYYGDDTFGSTLQL